MRPDLGVTIEGLDRLVRDLRALDGQLPQEVAVINQRAATIVARGASAAASSSPTVAHKLADTFRAGRRVRVGLVSFGGAAHPYAKLANWGTTARAGDQLASRHPERNARTGGTGWKGYARPWAGLSAGYLVGAGIARGRDEIVDLYDREINDLISRITG